MSTAAERREKIKELIVKLGEKILDNPDKFIEATILCGLGYLSYKSLGEDTTKFEEKLGSTLVGPILYKMATSDGGTPPIPQCVGMAGLAALGLTYVNLDTRSILNWFLNPLTLPIDNPPPATPPEVKQEDMDAAVNACQNEGAAVGSEFWACISTKLLGMGYTKEQLGLFKWPWDV